MNSRTHMPTDLEIEDAKWPDAPGRDDPIELAIAIAGECWRVVVHHHTSHSGDRPPALNVEKRIIFISSHQVRHRLYRRIALAKRIVCIQRVAGGSSAVAQQLIETLLGDDGE